jgi:hypothetical protein
MGATSTIASRLAASVVVIGLTTGSSRAEEPAAASAGSQLQRELEGLVRSLDGPEALSAIHFLREVGPEAAAARPVLAAKLTHGDPQIRSASAWALAFIGKLGPTELEALRVAANDSDAEVRRAAIGALGGMEGDPPPWLLERIAAGCKSPREDEQAECLHALAHFGTRARAHAPVVEELLAAGEGYLRLTAAQTLIALTGNSPPALKVLQEGLRHAKSNVRVHALELFADLGAKATSLTADVEALLKAKEADVRFFAADALWRLDGNAEKVMGVLDALLQAGQVIQDEEDPEIEFNVARHAIGILEEMGPAAKPALPALEKAVRNRRLKLDVRVDAVLAAWKISGALTGDGERLLWGALLDDDEFPRLRVLRRLRESGRKEAAVAKAVREQLDDRDARIRIAALLALKVVGE